MNDHEPHDRKLLELATSRTLAPHEPLAEGPRELRSAWLTMGQALDEENADFREVDLLDRLRARLDVPVALPEPRGGSGRVWPALLASALALCLLMAIVHSSWFGEGASYAVKPETIGPSAEGWPDSDMAWSDALDAELEAAAQRVGAVVQSTGVDDSLANLADHLESLSDELSGSSL